MNSIPFVHEGLGNSSYLVATGQAEALVVDPDRNVRRYVERAAALGLQITRVLETHLHADFVTGARELQALGATVLAPSAGGLRYPHHPLVAGDTIAAGELRIDVIGSPGHTQEHIAFASAAHGRPPTLFSGGSIIVGGAARTDLISPDLTEQLTRLQYRTVTRAFQHLPDDTLVQPTHGAGSFCSTGAGADRTSTLGVERRTNPVFSEGDEEEFVRWFPAAFPAAPDYFFRLRAVNQFPRLNLEIPPPPALDVQEFEARSAHGVVVDVRPQAEFMKARIPGSVSIAFRDAFATWLGWLIKPGTPIFFVLGDERLEDVIGQSLLVGLEDLGGWLQGGFEAWEAQAKPVARLGLVTATTANKLLADGVVAVDVREAEEFNAGHIPGAIHIPAGQLQSRVGELPKDRPLITYCGHGERSASALSILERLGVGPLMNLDLGIEGWTAEGLPIELPAPSRE